MNKTLQHALKGYFLFNVNGKNFKTYGGALKASESVFGDIILKGHHITRGSEILYEKSGTPLWNKQRSNPIDRRPKRVQSESMKNTSLRQWTLILPRVIIILPVLIVGRIFQKLSFWLKSFEDYMDGLLR